MLDSVGNTLDIVASSVLPLDAPVRKVEKVKYEVVNCRTEIGDRYLNVSGEVLGEIIYHDWAGGKETKRRTLRFDENIPVEDTDRILEVFAQPFIKDSFVRVNGMRNLFQHILVGIELDVLEKENEPGVGETLGQEVHELQAVDAGAPVEEETGRALSEVDEDENAEGDG